MNTKSRLGFVACFAFLYSPAVWAQDAGPLEPSAQEPIPAADGLMNSEATQPPVCEASTPVEYVLPKLTEVSIQIDATLTSKESAQGEIFPITLARPVMLGDVEVLPAGLTGEGEVIHAKKAGFGGSGGELIITANFIENEGERIRLRSMQMAKTGGNNIGLASAIAAAPYVGPVAFFISGKNITVSAGTVAGAKLADDVVIRKTQDGGEVAAGGCNMGVGE